VRSHSRGVSRVLLVAAALLLGGSAFCAQPVTPPRPPARPVLNGQSAAPAVIQGDGSSFSPATVGAAVAKLKNDPNLRFSRYVHTLRWAGKTEKPSSKAPGWLDWLLNLGRWIGEIGRIFVWVVCAIVAALIVIFVVRIIRAANLERATIAAHAPTHVRDLDIRPESLPDDIGASATELWNRGEHRHALALLYRGALSRLVHAHGVSIRHSSTEGECVALAAQHLNAGATGYFAQLVRVWQRAVYGGTDPETDVVLALCDGFSAALDPPPPAAAPASAAA
jgi:hypothetical protein